MRSLPLFFVLTLLAILSCNRKQLPVVADRQSSPPSIRQLQYPPRETIRADTLMGNRLFAARCGRCHGLPEPSQFTIARWESILPLMFPRSRFNNEESLHVRAYVLANAAR